MRSEQRRAAVETAKERLDRIESWSRRTFYTTFAGVVLAYVTFVGAVYKYWQVSTAYNSAVAELQQKLQQYPKH